MRWVLPAGRRSSVASPAPPDRDYVPGEKTFEPSLTRGDVVILRAVKVVSRSLNHADQVKQIIRAGSGILTDRLRYQQPACPVVITRGRSPVWQWVSPAREQMARRGYQ